MNLLKVDDLAEALAKLTARAACVQPPVEEASLEQCLGRTLAADIYAEENIPAFARAVMDGYAVRAADVQGAGESIPAFLSVAGEVRMGEEAGFALGAGECAYVPTGAMMPAGADAVVMEEYCEKASPGKIAAYKSEAPGSNVAAAGEDMKKGELVLRRGRRLKPQDLGLLAALGRAQVSVYRPYRVFIISTGDELAGPEEEASGGRIRDVNTYGLIGKAAAAGFVISGRQRVKDEEELLAQAVEEGKQKADIVVVSGGSSKGRRDVTATVIEQAASSGVFTHGIAVKPGKPTILGVDEPSATVLAGLPGHPVAALMLFELIVGGLWRAQTGQEPRRGIRARLSINLPATPGRQTFQLVKLRTDGAAANGAAAGYAGVGGGEGNIAEPVLGKSGMIYTMSRADGYIVIDKNREGLKQGEAVEVFLF